MPILFYIAMWSWALGVMSCLRAGEQQEAQRELVMPRDVARAP